MPITVENALEALRSKPKTRHCISCWEFAITDKNSATEAEKNLLKDIADLISINHFGVGLFGTEALAKCTHPNHNSVSNTLSTPRWVVWAE